MQRLFRGWFFSAALVFSLALGMPRAGAQSAFEVDRFILGETARVVAVSEATGRFYVVQDDLRDGVLAGNLVAVIDGETHAPLAPLVFGPDTVVGDVVVHPTNGRIYVSLVNEGFVAVVDEASGQILRRIPVLSRPLAMAIDASADRLYIQHEGTPALSTIKINALDETREEPRIGPEQAATLPRSTGAGLAVDPQRGRIYHRVRFEDGRCALLLLFREPGPIRATAVFNSPGGQVVVNPLTNVVYLSLEEERQLQPVSGGNGLLVHTPIGLGTTRPHGLALDRLSARLFITDVGGNQVGIFDVGIARATAPALFEVVTVAENPRAVVVNSLTRRAYVANSGDPSLSIIRDKSFTLPQPTVSADPVVASGEWTNRDVTLNLSFGPGLVVGRRELVFQSLGTLAIPKSAVSRAVPIRFSEEGISALFFAARGGSDPLASEADPAIHLSPPGIFQVRIDKTPPVATLGTFDRRRWFRAGEVVVTGTSTDALSGLANPTSDATFALRADGREGEEIADGQTDARTILDLAGNSVTAGPITGIRIDRKAPTLTVQSPAESASFFLNQRVAARFSARDGGSGLRSVRGLFLTGDVIANGGRLLTGRVGRGQPFAVLAVDNVGNQSDSQRTYTVRYRIRRIDNGTFRLPGNLAWKLQLQDAARKNQSASEIPVVALRIEPVSGGAATEINQSFTYNPTLGGRGGGYELALSFRSLPRGAYRLIFTADGVEHETRFTVR
jgi:DNA-binding beta-propeller fold protein YncE